MITDEEAEVAKTQLRAAIAAYYEAIEPEVYVDDWVLLVHKDSIDMAQQNVSSIGMVVPTGQPFHRTAGLVLLGGQMVDYREDD